MEPILITLDIFEDDYSKEQSWQLVEWCLENGADEWTIDRLVVDGGELAWCLHFDETTERFRKPSALRRRLSALTSESLVRQTDLWRLTPDALDVLKSALPDGLFDYHTSRNGWFEDLTIYRDGELMLGVVVHEGEGILFVTSAERDELVRAGFVFYSRGSILACP